MGSNFVVYCTMCNTQEEFKVGLGRMIFDTPDLLLPLLRPKDQKHIKHIFDKYEAKIKDYPQHDMYECPKCETLHSRYSYQIEYGENSVYVKQYQCSKCRTTLIKIPEEFDYVVSDYNCKKCHEKNLTFIGFSTMWD